MWRFFLLALLGLFCGRCCVLSAQLAAFGRGARPTVHQRRAKEELLERLREAVEAVESLREPLQGLKVVPFGSSVNGLGEGGADVDAALWFAPSKEPVTPVEVLKRVAVSAPNCGFQVLEQRWSAQVPVLVLQFNELSCDVTAFHLLPVGSLRAWTHASHLF